MADLVAQRTRTKDQRGEHQGVGVNNPQALQGRGA